MAVPRTQLATRRRARAARSLPTPRFPAQDFDGGPLPLVGCGVVERLIERVCTFEGNMSSADLPLDQRVRTQQRGRCPTPARGDDRAPVPDVNLGSRGS